MTTLTSGASTNSDGSPSIVIVEPPRPIIIVEPPRVASASTVTKTQATPPSTTLQQITPMHGAAQDRMVASQPVWALVARTSTQPPQLMPPTAAPATTRPPVSTPSSDPPPQYSAMTSAALDALDLARRGVSYVGTKLYLIGMSELQKNHSVSRTFTLPEGLCFAPMVHVLVHPPTEFNSDPTRAWHKEGLFPRWVTVGIAAEIGTGGLLEGTIPIAATGVSVSGGAGIKGMVEMEYTMPLHLRAVASADDVSKSLSGKTVVFVTNVADLERLAVGETRTLRGRGTAYCHAGVGYGAQAGFGPFTAGLGVTVDGRVTYTGELAMEIKKLLPEVVADPSHATDGSAHNVVRMTLLESNGLASRLQTSIGGQISADSGAIVPTGDLPAEGSGLLKALCTIAGGGSSAEGFIAKYTKTRTTTGITDDRSVVDQNTLLFALGVSPVADKALAQALTWDFTLAYRLAELHRLNPAMQTGVRHASHHAQTHRTGFDLSVILLGMDLMRFQMGTEKRTGILRDADGHTMAYAVCAPTQFYRDEIHGSQSLTCKATMVRVGDDPDGPLEPVLDIEYEANDFRTHSDEIRFMLVLAALSGDKNAISFWEQNRDVFAQLDRVSFWQRLTDDDNSKRRARIRCMPDALRAFVRMPEEYTEKDGTPHSPFVDCYLHGCLQLDPTLQHDVDALCSNDVGARLRIRNDARIYTTHAHQSIGSMILEGITGHSPSSHHAKALAAEYLRRDGTNLPILAALLAEADDFARDVHAIQKEYFDTTGDAKAHAERLAFAFSQLGQRHGFHFTRIMAALFLLMDQKDVHVQELSVTSDSLRTISGANLSFKSTEGELRDTLAHIADAMNPGQFAAKKAA